MEAIVFCVVFVPFLLLVIVLSLCCLALFDLRFLIFSFCTFWFDMHFQSSTLYHMAGISYYMIRGSHSLYDVFQYVQIMALMNYFFNILYSIVLYGFTF